MTRRIAITGATGFVGRHTLEALKADGWSPRILVRQPVDANAAPFAGVEQIAGDLFNHTALDRLVAGCDAVLHLAGTVKAARDGDYFSTNTQGTKNLAHAWQRSAPEARLVFVSSMAAREPGLSAYARSKAAAEQAVREVGADKDWRILRPSAVYGPGDKETLTIFKLADAPIQPMLNAPDARLCLVHVRDVAGAIAATLADPQPGTMREITDAEKDGYRWDDLVAAAARALGRASRPCRVPAPLLRALGGFGDGYARITGRPALLSSGKAREILHPDWSADPAFGIPPDIWQPGIRLAEGFSETIAWYRAKGWLKPALHNTMAGTQYRQARPDGQ